MEFNITIDGNHYKLAFTKKNNWHYTCMVFDTNDLIVRRNFTIIYDKDTKKYGAWTGNTIFQDEMNFRNKVANLLNEGKLKLDI